MGFWVHGTMDTTEKVFHIDLFVVLVLKVVVAVALVERQTREGVLASAKIPPPEHASGYQLPFAGLWIFFFMFQSLDSRLLVLAGNAASVTSRS